MEKNQNPFMYPTNEHTQDNGIKKNHVKSRAEQIKIEERIVCTH